MQTKEQNIKLELFPPLPHLHLGIFLLYIALFVHLLCAVLWLSHQPDTFLFLPLFLASVTMPVLVNTTDQQPVLRPAGMAQLVPKHLSSSSFKPRYATFRLPFGKGP